jgi:hypothetical protein
MECVLDRPFQFAKRAVRGAILCTGEDGKVDGGWMQQCGEVIVLEDTSNTAHGAK